MILHAFCYIAIYLIVNPQFFNSYIHIKDNSDYFSNNHTSSRNFTGKGARATYPNGDVYVGDFLDGVST